MATSASHPSDNIEDGSTNSNFINYINNIRASIQQHYSFLIDAIRQSENQLLQELDSIEQTYIQKYQSTIVESEKTNKQTLASLSSDDMKDSSPQNPQNVSFEWDTNLANKVSLIGNLITTTASLSIDYKKKVNPILKTCKQGSGAGQIDYAYGVATENDTNDIYVADHHGNCVCVFSSEGEFLFQFNGSINNTVKMSNPIGIAIYENKVFVSQHSSHCIQIYYLDGTYIQQFGSQGSGKNQLNYPYGIGISSINGYIYVCEYDNTYFFGNINNNRVQIFSRDYKHKSFLGVNQLKCPRDVKLVQKEIFILAILGKTSSCVHVYDYNNILLRSIINKTRGGYKIIDAYCMYVDRDNNIILSDYGGGCVLIFSCTGKIIHQIGNIAKMFTHPQGVMVDALGRLIVVSQQPDACIQIF